jgi:hypothetical protein
LLVVIEPPAGEAPPAAAAPHAKPPRAAFFVQGGRWLNMLDMCTFHVERVRACLEQSLREAGHLSHLPHQNHSSSPFESSQSPRPPGGRAQARRDQESEPKAQRSRPRAAPPNCTPTRDHMDRSTPSGPPIDNRASQSAMTSCSCQLSNQPADSLPRKEIQKSRK